MTHWRRVLEDAAESVSRAVARTSPAERNRVLGVGASGDRTLVADRRAEDELIRNLMQVGDISILSEERGSLGSRDARYLAVLDPLDGSSNFSRGVPFFCTSIGILEGRRLCDAKYALVRDLVHGDSYFAEKGRGAWKNGECIRSSKVTKVGRAVVGIDISRSSPRAIGRLRHLLAAAYRQVHLGANALELCMVAEGRLDAFVDVRGKMRVTDLAAAYLIANEAGVLVTDSDGQDLDPQVSLSSRFSFVAAPKTLQREILSLLNVNRGRP
ncbi:MAG: fructose 1,6-bisphosphatase [Nitrososphaerota archaeon]|nr:fructose 1,6-bisphosphatase [Nitrososphaerota archaeon]